MNYDDLKHLGNPPRAERPGDTISFLGIKCSFVEDKSYYPQEYPRWYEGELAGAKLRVSYNPYRSRLHNLEFEAGLSFSDSFLVHCFAASIEECEKEMRDEISEIERSLGSVCRHLANLGTQSVVQVECPHSYHVVNSNSVCRFCDRLEKP